MSSRSLALTIAIAALAIGAPAASTEVTPYLNGVAPVCDSTGHDSGTHVQLWGWKNTNPVTESSAFTFLAPGPDNLPSPGAADRGQPRYFENDSHRDYAFGLTWQPAGDPTPVWRTAADGQAFYPGQLEDL